MKRKHHQKIRKLPQTMIVGGMLATLLLASCTNNNVATTQQTKVLNVGNRTLLATGGGYDSQNNPYSLVNFTKILLTQSDARNYLLKNFVKELIFNWYQKQLSYDQSKVAAQTKVWKQQYDQVVKAVDQQYQQALNQAGSLDNLVGQRNFQQQTLDFHGGNSATYKHQAIVDQLYNKFMQMLNLKTDNFSLIAGADFDSTTHALKVDNKNILAPNHQLSASDLNNSANWDKIGFYPQLVANDHGAVNKQTFFGLANFQNFAYQQWQNAVKPFNVVMSLWKYNDSSDANLATVYNQNTLLGNFPTKSDYKFPYYQQKDQNQISTAEKFQHFVANLENAKVTPHLKSAAAFNVAVGYTDDRATSIYANAHSIFNELYPQFAAGAVHKFLQLTAGKDLTSQHQDVTKDVNPITYDELKKRDLISLFLEKQPDNKAGASGGGMQGGGMQGGASSPTKLIGIPINFDIFNTTSKYHEYNFSLDQRDLANSPWMFLRNQAGVHAIAIDGYNYILDQDWNGTTASQVSNGTSTQKTKTTAEYLKRAFHFYNYRVLQNINKTALDLKNVPELTPLKDANAYLSNHFDSLIVDYFLKHLDSKNKETKGLFDGVTNPLTTILGQLQNNGKFTQTTKTEQDELKNILTALVNIDYAKPQLANLVDAKTKLQTQYLNFDLTAQTSGNNHYSDYSNGLASVMPYQPQVDFTKIIGEDNQGDYPSLDAIYDLPQYNHLSDIYKSGESSSFSSPGPSGPNGKTTTHTLKSYYETIQTNVDNLINALKLGPSTQIQYVNLSQVLLTNSYLINRVTDDYLNGATNNLSNIVSVLSLTRNYLKGLFDPSTNLVLKDFQLGDNFKFPFETQPQPVVKRQAAASGVNGTPGPKPAAAKPATPSTSSSPAPAAAEAKPIGLNSAISNYYYGTTYKDAANPLIYGGFNASSDSNQDSDQAQKRAKREAPQPPPPAPAPGGSNGIAGSPTDPTATTLLSLTNKYDEIFNNHLFVNTNNGYNIFSTANVAYLEFLRTLAYLSQDHFENLRLYLKSAFGPQTNGAFYWSTRVLKSDNSNLSTDTEVKAEFQKFHSNYLYKLANPFVLPNADLNDAKSNYLDSLNYSTNKLENHSYRGFGGLIINSPLTTWNNPTNAADLVKAINDIGKYNNNDHNGILFNFGSLAELVQYIKNFNSVSEVDQLVQQLQKLVPSLAIGAISANLVSVKSSSGGSNINHSLTLFEKQNALLALINNYKMITDTNNISVDDYKRVYGTDPTNDFSPIKNHQYTLQTKDKTGSYQDNLANDYYTRFHGLLASNDNKNNTNNQYGFNVDNDFMKLAYVIQVNQQDFATAASFSKLIQDNLGTQSFANWLVMIANQDQFKQLSKTDFENNLAKLTVHDARFQKLLSSTYITNK